VLTAPSGVFLGFSTAQPTTIYADPGTNVILGFFSSISAGATLRCEMVISGRLIAQ
jgi:hypothetical protein